MVTSGLSLGTRVSNLKSAALIVLELFAFYAQKFRGSRDPGHAPFGENFLGSCPQRNIGFIVYRIPGNMCVKFEVRSFNRFGAISI